MAEQVSKKAKMDDLDLATKCINNIRVLAADMIQKANSGHPGAPMGCAPMAHTLWGQIMNYAPSDPKWASRDRFVLSNGHGCTLQYSMLHMTGYDLPMEELKRFRQLGSKTPGHPENHLTPGIEVSTGPLGQGISNAVGLAVAEAFLGAKFNKPGFDVVSNYTYVICGDGCLQEGVSGEASSLAGHLGLGKLIVLYDDNLITIDGDTSLSFTEDVGKRYEAYGWHVLSVADGNTYDVTHIRDAILEAQKVTDKPSLIKIRTIIGLGSGKQGTHGVHGSPLGNDDLKMVKTKFGFDPAQSFVVLPEVYDYYRQKAAEGEANLKAWRDMFGKYSAAYPELAAEFTRIMKGDLPADWETHLPSYKTGDPAEASRKSSSTVLASLVAHIPEFVGGAADLTPSTLTKVPANKIDFSASHREGNYIRYGVREHAMAAICNGMAAFGGIIPFCSTFLNFVGYALGAIRLSALSHFKVVYVMTHDSIGLGEDGPTHQPVETLASLRSMPNMLVLRPCDGNEVVGAYHVAMTQHGRPSVLALSRQNLPNLAGSSRENVSKGAYVIYQTASSPAPQVVLVATGSEVELCVKAAAALEGKGLAVRVVSFPSWELFEEQTEEYKKSVFFAGAPVLSVEAASVMGWEKYSHAQIGMRTFGASAPSEQLFPHFGFTPSNIAEKAEKLVHFYKGNAPDLFHKLVF